MSKNFSDLLNKVNEFPIKKLSVAAANDDEVIEAAAIAHDRKIADSILVGDKDQIESICKDLKVDPSIFEIVDIKDPIEAAHEAVRIVHDGEADMYMKGLLSTDKYMRAILNKECGLMPGKKNDMLTHMAVMEVPAYHKLLCCSDMAIIPAPDFKQKTAIMNFLIQVSKSLENPKPKVAVLAATEQVSIGMPACAEAAWLGMQSLRGQIPGAVVDGPLSLDCAIDKESAQTKKLTSEVAGDADCLLFPNIEAGNIFYKACTKFAHAELACMVMGARVPCVLTSRGDSAKTKLYSIALAALQCK